MSDEKIPEPTQPTQPRGKDEEGDIYPPIQIPIPKKRDVLDVLKKSARPIPEKSD